MIGLSNDVVKLCDHDPAWDSQAADMIARLRHVLGPVAVDIQHVGSTAIKTIKAKPIIDIMVSVADLQAFMPCLEPIARLGYVYKPDVIDDELFLYRDDPAGRGRLSHLHVVVHGRQRWHTYVTFRDFLRAHPDQAARYQQVKLDLAARYPADRPAYTAGKAAVIHDIMRRALPWYYLGRTVRVAIDRPVGHVHRKDDRTLTYPINYGYIPGVLGGDGEELDVYVLGTAKPLAAATVRIAAKVLRADDVEDKLVGLLEGSDASPEAMAAAIAFQEKYYDSRIVTDKEMF